MPISLGAGLKRTGMDVVISSADARGLGVLGLRDGRDVAEGLADLFAKQGRSADAE